MLHLFKGSSAAGVEMKGGGVLQLDNSSSPPSGWKLGPDYSTAQYR